MNAHVIYDKPVSTIPLHTILVFTSAHRAFLPLDYYISFLIANKKQMLVKRVTYFKRRVQLRCFINIFIYKRNT